MSCIMSFPWKDWAKDYSRYMSQDGVEMTHLLYHHGYGYAPYGAYSPARSPVPTMGHDGLYGPQHYQGKPSQELEKMDFEKIPKFKAGSLNKKIFENKGGLGCNSTSGDKALEVPLCN
ncbi:hypothetical protein C5167_001424 [Papaver somniferum]|uniref:Uncharacterized protein n=1 Tax=Papaver somniferum TaxID=3469 RepID=A0A4Y7KZ09_PAPSO|nr:hypothetical protein C5167_001423 [Papaver somniferum]RZC77200.1 hypothetical protein C5167_001424 [Papaver somniferum]